MTQDKSNDERDGEANEVVSIIKNEFDPEKDQYMVLVDLNDTPKSDALSVVSGQQNSLGLVNGTCLLQRTDKLATSPKRRLKDTYLWKREDKASGSEEKSWSPIDDFLISRALWQLKSGEAKILNSPSDQGSDHYLSWGEFNVPSGLAV